MSSCFDEGSISSSGPGGLPIAGVDIADLAGTWNAVKAQFTSQEGTPTQQLQVVASGGSTTLEVVDNGRFTLIILPPTGASQIVTGLFEIDGGVFAVRFDADPNVPIAWTIMTSGTSLNLTGPIAYDFLNNNNLQTASMELDLVKQ